MAALLPALQGLLNLAAIVFAVASMLAVGLGHDWREIFEPLRQWQKVLRALAVNFVLVPVVAYAVARILPLEEAHATGLFLVAAAAGAPFLLKLTEAAGGDVALSATLLVVLLPATIMYMPIVVPLEIPDAGVSAFSIARPLVLTMLLPLGIGLVMHAKAARWARRMQQPMGKVSTIALIVLVAATVLANLPGLLVIFRSAAILAAVILIAGPFAIGYGLGGPGRASKEVLGLGSAQRNIAAATIVATQAVGHPDTVAMVVVFSIVDLAILFPIAWALRKRRQALAVSH
jgi:BASS family bile acid:Na+ symporter